MCKRIFASQTSESGDVPFYKIGTIGGQADAYISYELFNQYRSRYHFPNQGETLITCSGTVGRCIQYDGRPAYFQDSNIVWLHGDRSPITSNFLFRLLSKRNWKTLNTTTISRIYSSDLLGLRLFYPPIVEEQERISDFLSLLDQRIEVQNKIIEELRSYKKSTFGLLTSQIYRFEKIAIGHLIEEYDERTIHSNEYPVLSSTSDGVYLQKDFFKKDHSSEDTTGYKKIPYGYCVYRSMSDTGRFYFNIQNRVPMGIVSPAYPVFRVREEAASYLTLFLNCDPKVINDLYKQKAGGTRFALPLSRIKRVAIPWPDEHFRKRVCDLFLAIERRLENESNLLRSFLLQKQFLLANMFI